MAMVNSVISQPENDVQTFQDVKNDTNTNGYSHEELLTKHRKERKEFQGQVLSIKKSTAKADKKKKKEAAEQIARLELQLDERQNEELRLFELNRTSELVKHGESMIAESKLNRVTKAQRRRDKKVTKTKERELEIEVQAVENIHGARNVETKKIKHILKDRNLMIQEISSDGNCLYCAIDHQWQLINGEAIGLKNLRIKTSEYLRKNSSDFLPFITHPDTEEMLTEEQYEEYCNNVANTPAWGGEVELRALSHVLKWPIEVIQSNGPSIVVGEEYENGKPLILTYHRHMYGLGEHYNSVKSYEDLQEDEMLPLTAKLDISC